MRGRLLRTIGGPPKRPEYWLGELAVPVSWRTDGVTRSVRHVILTARWEGTALGPGAKLPVNLWYVIGDSVATRDSFDVSQAQFVAIGTMMVSSPDGGPTLITLEVPCDLSSPRTTPSSERA